MISHPISPLISREISPLISTASRYSRSYERRVRTNELRLNQHHSKVALESNAHTRPPIDAPTSAKPVEVP